MSKPVTLIGHGASNDRAGQRLKYAARLIHSLAAQCAFLFVLSLALPQSAAAAAPGTAPPPSALSRLPDDAVQKLRTSVMPPPPTSRDALRLKLEEIEASATAVETNGSASVAFGRPETNIAMRSERAAAQRAELRPLREQVQRELATLQAQVRDQAGVAQANAMAKLAEQANQRFDRLDQLLQRLELADNAGAPQAQRELARLLLSLRAQPEAVPATPVPTLRAWPPQTREPGRGGASEQSPQYVLDLLSELRRNLAGRSGGGGQGQRAGFGYMPVAATLPPVSPSTTTDCSAVSADLADDGAEVQLTSQVRALAQNLNYSPSRILRWMQQEIAFEPYWGSLKGSLGVLQSRAGNSTDQASLLIALLRASNVPARFVRGTVAVLDPQPTNNADGRVSRWLGTKNYSAAAAYLNSGGTPAGPSSINGAMHGVLFDHVWVQACVPYAAYRGNLAEAGGYRWVPMDAVVKDHDYQAGISVNVALDANFYSSYLSVRRDQLPPDYLADAVEQAARSIKADASEQDVPYSGTPRSPRFDVLPSTPPYTVAQFTNWPGMSAPESATVPDAHRHKFTVTVKNPFGTVLVTSTATFPQQVFARLTVSYAPDAASQALWNGWGGAMSSLPAGAVQVLPVIKRDGVAVASGNGTMALGAQHTVSMRLTQGEATAGHCLNDAGTGPDGDGSCLNKTLYDNVKAGAYYALGVNANQASPALLDQRAATLAANLQSYPIAPTPAAGAAYDATVGELLHLVLQTYLHGITEADSRMAALRGFKSTGYYDIGLTGSEIKTEYLFDLPLAVKPAGVYVDFKGGTISFVKIDTAADFGPNRAATLRAEQAEMGKLSIYAGSALEHHVWQQALRTDAVSTVRGLQFAAETGIPLVTFTAANIGQYTSLMQMSGPGSMASYQASLTAEVAAGATVTVPRSQIAYVDPVDPSKAWRGAVYMSENATTGAYGAIIAGSLSGGYPLISAQPITSLFTPTSNAPSFASNLAADPVLAVQATAPGRQGSNSFASFVGDPVNMLTGALVHNETDLQVKGRGLPIVLARWYNSGNPQDGPLGWGWTHSFNHVLKLYGVESVGGAAMAKVGWVNGSGGETFFSTTQHNNGNLAPGAVLANPAGTYVQFSRVAGGVDDGKLRIRERDGTVYLFASALGPSGVPSATSAVIAPLLSITDRNGNRLTLNYSGTQLSSVSDSLGRTVLNFSWTAGRISQVSDYTGRAVAYEYGDGQGNLTRAIDAAGQGRDYSYYSSADGPKLAHRLKRQTLPRGNGMAFEYYSGGQVFRHTPFDTSGQLLSDAATSFHYNLFNRESWSVDGRGHEQRFTFDAYGNAIRIVQGDGAEHRYEYSSNKPYLRLSETDSIGRITRYTYNQVDLLDATTLPSGATVMRSKYNEFAQPGIITDARGNQTWLRYDSAGNLTDSVRVKAGVSLSAQLPAPSEMLAWTKTSYDSNGWGNPVTTTQVTDFAAGTGPRLTRNWSVSGVTAGLNVLSLTRSGQRSNGTPGQASAVSQTSPTFTYDALNRMTGGVDQRWYPTIQSYDALDRVLTASDALGKLRSTRYDANGNAVLSELLDDGTRIDSSAAAFDALDRPITLLDHAGNKTAMVYDAVGNLVQRRSPDNVAIGIDYDAANRPFAAYDEEGNRVHTRLDTQGRPLTVTDPNGAVTTYTYWGAEQDGRLRRTTAPALAGQASGRALEQVHDAEGRVLRSRAIAANGSVRESFNFYDELGRPVRQVGLPDDQGQRLQTCLRYGNLGLLTEVWAGPSIDTQAAACSFSEPGLVRQQASAWDDFGQLLNRTDALGMTWRWGWDYYGNLVNSQSPVQANAGLATSYSYDPTLNGQLQTRTVAPVVAPGFTGPSGQTVAYTRNALGQVRRAETRDGLGNLLVAYDHSYDVAHRLSLVRDSRGNKAMGYSWTPGGRLAKTTLQDAGRITHTWDYRYDAVGRLAAIVAPNGRTVTMARDAGGRLIERIVSSAAASADVNGNAGDTPVLNSSFAWNADGSLASIRHQARNLFYNPSLQGVAQFDYSYDNWGNRQTLTENIYPIYGRTTTYVYDALDRLKSLGYGDAAAAESYAYDLFGNRTSKTLGSGTAGAQSWAYAHDAVHQLTAVSGSSQAVLRYDANGNLVKLCEGNASATAANGCTGTKTTAMSWDGLDQMVGLAQAGAQALNEAYVYDDSGRRISKTSNGGAQHYLYDGQNIAAIWSGELSGRPNFAYVHASTDEPLMRLSDDVAGPGGSSGVPGAYTCHYMQDGIGSVRAFGCIDTPSGVMNTTFVQSFDTWGTKVSAGQGVADVSPDAYSFTGRELDASGLNYHRLRYYHPVYGRFTSRDPIGLAGGINPYAYAGNDPVSFADPSGLLAAQVGNAVSNYAGLASDFGSGFSINFGLFSSQGSSILDRAPPGIDPDAFEAGRATGNFLYQMGSRYGQASAGGPVALMAAGPLGLRAAAAEIGAATTFERTALSLAAEASIVARARGATGGAVSGGVSGDARIFTGASTNAGGPGFPTAPIVQQAVSETPLLSRSDFHGCCGEINLMSNLVNAGAQLQGTVIATVRAAGRQAGQLLSACSTCQWVANRLGVTIVNPPKKP
jgi:RHS repeat-associated protein